MQANEKSIGSDTVTVAADGSVQVDIPRLFGKEQFRIMLEEMRAKIEFHPPKDEGNQGAN